MPIVRKNSQGDETEEISLEDKQKKQKAKKEKNIGKKIELDEKKPKVDKVKDETDHSLEKKQNYKPENKKS